jgi:hypothetical protein
MITRIIKTKSAVKVGKRGSASHVEGRSTAARKRKSGGVVRDNRAKSETL